MKPITDLIGGRPVHTLPGSATVFAAAQEMEARNVGAILVLDDEARLAGIFTERDLMKRVVVPGLDPAGTTLADVMTRELYTAKPDDNVSEVAALLQARHIRHAPVVENGEIVGILSLRDLLRAHLDVKLREVDDLKRYIQGEES